MRFSGVFATLAVVVALSGSVAWSMDMDMDMGMDSEKMVGYKAMDANKDGTVTRKEFRNFSKMKFKEIDKDERYINIRKLTYPFQYFRHRICNLPKIHKIRIQPSQPSNFLNLFVCHLILFSISKLKF
jgi:hypothetical protein